jgi:tetratricopeptide (TPR) repeat protein
MAGKLHRLRLVLKRTYLWGRGAVTFIVGLAVTAVVIAVAVALIRDLTSDAIRIDALQVPKAVANAGLSPEVAARRLRDAMHDIVIAASAGNSPSLQLAGDVPNVVVPTVGISFADLSEFLRNAVGLSRHVVGGEIVGTAEAASLRLRIDGRVIYQSSSDDLRNDTFWHGAAEAILAQSSPYIVALAKLESDPATAVAEADQIITTLPSDDGNVPWAYLLRGANALDRGLPDRAEVDFQAAIRTSKGKLAPAHGYMGRALIDQGQWREASAQLRIATRLDPTDAAMEHYLAVALWGEGDFAAARMRFDHADKMLRDGIQSEPDNPILLRSLANSLQMQGRLREALVMVHRALERAPRSGETMLAAASIDSESGYAVQAAQEALDATNRLAHPSNAVLVVAAPFVAQATGRPAAIRMLDRAIAADPDYAVAYQERGQLLKQIGQTAAAEADFVHALSLNPSLLNALMQEGDSRIRAHDAEAADRAFRKACDIDVLKYDCLFTWSDAVATVDPKRAQSLRGEAFANLAAVGTAMPDAELFPLTAEVMRQRLHMPQPALNAPPPLPTYLSARCETLMATSRGAAREYCDQAIRLAPGEPIYREQLARLLAMDDSAAAHNDAIGVLLEALHVDGPRVSTLVGLARQLDALHQNAAARATWLRALRLDPDDGWLQYDVAFELDEGAMLTEAVPYYRRAWQLLPDQWLAANDFAWALYRTGAVKEALAPMRFAAAQQPQSAQVVGHAVDCFVQAERWDEARETLDRWIDSHPRDAVAHDMRGGIEYEHGYYAAAVADYQAALDIKPNDRDLQLSLQEARTAMADLGGDRPDPPPPPDVPIVPAELPQ